VATLPREAAVAMIEEEPAEWYRCRRRWNS